jgi:N-acetylglutamate synthase-like GNAT family acetyltransferase
MEFRFLAGPEILEAEKQIPNDQKVNWPVDSIVMYTYEGEQIVGRMGLMSIKFIEGTYIAPDNRNGRLLLQMMTQMEGVIKYLGNTHAMALSYDEQPQVSDYLKRLGFERFPVTMFDKELT